MLDAMKRHDVRRLVVVSSGAVTGEDQPTGGFLFNRVLQPYVTKRLGKTVYDDMRRMEDLVSRSDADWTILRPSGLYELPAVRTTPSPPNTGPAGSPPGSTWPTPSCARSRTTASSAGSATSSPRGTTPACSR